MRGAETLRHLAVAATLLLQPALARPQAGITVAPSPIAWVTVDAAGSAQTVRPAVITTEGHLATVSDAPSALRSPATYTLSPDGRASTYTGLAPVASATGTGGSLAGVFPACNSDVGPVEPFCLPRAGSELHPGKTYYITWSPSYFPADTKVSFQVLFSSSTNPGEGEGAVGFTADGLSASQGFYPWPVPADFLSSRGNPARYSVTFVLAYADDGTPSENDRVSRRGPAVFITSEDGKGTPGDNKGTGPNLVAIAVPVIVVGGFLLLSALCFMSWRRTGRVPLIGDAVGKMRRRSASGYGVRQSRSERVGAGVGPGTGPWGEVGADNKSETNVGIQLTDRDSWSPTGRSAGAAAETGGRNVFREEVERQARLR